MIARFAVPAAVGFSVAVAPVLLPDLASLRRRVAVFPGEDDGLGVRVTVVSIGCTVTRLVVLGVDPHSRTAEVGPGAGHRPVLVVGRASERLRLGRVGGILCIHVTLSAIAGDRQHHGKARVIGRC